MRSTTQEARQTASTMSKRNGELRTDAERQAREILAHNSHFRGRTKTFSFRLQDDVLTVRGSVPTYYLKQLIRSLLKNVKGIRHVDDQVDVVASSGLSSVREDHER